MKTIYKYKIEETVLIPVDAIRVHTDTQGGELYSWYLVDPDLPKETRHFRIVGTGHLIPSGYFHVATIKDTPFVWHVIESMYTESK